MSCVLKRDDTTYTVPDDNNISVQGGVATISDYTKKSDAEAEFTIKNIKKGTQKIQILGSLSDSVFTITCTGYEAKTLTVVIKVDGVEKSSITHSQTATITITAKTNYQVPVNITINNESGTSGSAGCT